MGGGRGDRFMYAKIPMVIEADAAETKPRTCNQINSKQYNTTQR